MPLLKAKLILSVEKMQNPGQNQTDMIKEYSDVFEGLGTFPGVHKIHLKPDAVPVVHPPRRIPVALRDELEKELKRMEDLGVIVKVSESTDWANSIATPEKQRTGAVRVCHDPNRRCPSTASIHPYALWNTLSSGGMDMAFEGIEKG